MEELTFEISKIAHDKVLQPLIEEMSWDIEVSVSVSSDLAIIKGDELKITLLKNAVLAEMEYYNHILKRLEQAK